MKAHIKRISIFLLYTLVFNTISFMLFSFLETYEHYYEAIILLVYGIVQICFTILFFNKVPLPKTSNKKDIKTDLLIYFLILCIASALAEMGIGIIFLMPNTYTFLLSFNSLSATSELYAYLSILIIENALKTFMLYTNISKKTLSKPICIVLSVIMVLPIIAFLVLLAMMNK